MRTRELIEQLTKMDPESEVYLLQVGDEDTAYRVGKVSTSIAEPERRWSQMPLLCEASGDDSYIVILEEG